MYLEDLEFPEAQGVQLTFEHEHEMWEPVDKLYPLKGIATRNSYISFLAGQTDWWRTRDKHQTNGPTRGFWRPADKGDFEVAVDITVWPEVETDQATLFLYLSPIRWIKVGIEYVDGQLWNIVVANNPFSDKSRTKRLPDDSKRFTVAYSRGYLKVYLGDDVIREVNWFGPTVNDDRARFLKSESKLFIGIMACCKGPGGARVEWNNITMLEGWRDEGLPGGKPISQ